MNKAIVCLNEEFFESGQAYVALSRVRNLDDLVLWDFDPSAIQMSSFYKQLLEWCDYVDLIRTTKPLITVDYPTKVVYDEVDIVCMQCDNQSPEKVPIPFADTHTDTVQVDTQPKLKRGRPQKESKKSSQSKNETIVPTKPKRGRGRPRIQPRETCMESKPKRACTHKLIDQIDSMSMQEVSSQSKNKPVVPTKPKRGRGRRRIQPLETCMESKPKRACTRKLIDQIDSMSMQEVSTSNHDSGHSQNLIDNESKPPHKKKLKVCHEIQIAPTDFTTSVLQQFHQYVSASLHGVSPRRILSGLSRQSVDVVCTEINSARSIYDNIVQHLNGLPDVYASQYPHLHKDNSILSLFHPLLFQTFKPVVTTGDGSCLFHALSLTLTGTETCTDLIRLLTAYALVKYRQAFLSAVQDANPTHHPRNILGVYNESIREAVDVRKWGTDYHLFALSHLFNRPILNYITDHNPHKTFIGVTTVEQLAECFRTFELDSQRQAIWCTNVHETLLSSGDVNSLPHLPISVINSSGYHWVAMLPLSLSAMQHIPVPKYRSLKE